MVGGCMESDDSVKSNVNDSVTSNNVVVPCLQDLEESVACFILSFLHAFNLAGQPPAACRNIATACRHDMLCEHVLSRDFAMEEHTPLSLQPTRPAYGDRMWRPRPSAPAALNLQVRDLMPTTSIKSGSAAEHLRGIVKPFCSLSPVEIAHAAARNGQASLLLWAAHRTPLNNVDGSGRSALMIAAENNRPLTLAAALEHCDIGQLHRKFGSALHSAAFSGAAAAATELVQAGARLEQMNDTFQQTPLHVACSRNHAAVVQILLDANADVRARDKDGLTAMNIATNLSPDAFLVLTAYNGRANA